MLQHARGGHSMTVLSALAAAAFSPPPEGDVPPALEQMLRDACVGAWRAVEVVLAGDVLRGRLSKTRDSIVRDAVEGVLALFGGPAVRPEALGALRAAREAGAFDGALDVEAVVAAVRAEGAVAVGRGAIAGIRRDLAAHRELDAVLADHELASLLIDAARAVFRALARDPELARWAIGPTGSPHRDRALAAFAELVGSPPSVDELESLIALPIALDENVQFTVYRPRAIDPGKWHQLLAFAHLAERRPGEDDLPDPVEEVQRQAKQVLGDKAAVYQPVTQDAATAIPAEGELTFVPELPGIEVNPPRRSFLWLESVHREEFRIRAPATLDGKTVRGRLTVFLGAIAIAEVALTVKVDAARPEPRNREPAVARTYRKIFASYSHRDLAIVNQFESYARALGDEYMRDWVHLRTGEVWNDRLQELIKGADAFQLFWSTNSMHSKFVRQEYEYALSLDRPSFVRPTYWEDPMPTAPGLPPEALLRLHFQKLGGLARSTVEQLEAVDVARKKRKAERADEVGGVTDRHLAIGDSTDVHEPSFGDVTDRHPPAPPAGDTAVEMPAAVDDDALDTPLEVRPPRPAESSPMPAPPAFEAPRSPRPAEPERRRMAASAKPDDIDIDRESPPGMAAPPAPASNSPPAMQQSARAGGTAPAGRLPSGPGAGKPPASIPPIQPRPGAPTPIAATPIAPRAPAPSKPAPAEPSRRPGAATPIAATPIAPRSPARPTGDQAEQVRVSRAAAARDADPTKPSRPVAPTPIAATPIAPRAPASRPTPNPARPAAATPIAASPIAPRAPAPSSSRLEESQRPDVTPKDERRPTPAVSPFSRPAPARPAASAPPPAEPATTVPGFAAAPRTDPGVAAPRSGHTPPGGVSVPRRSARSALPPAAAPDDDPQSWTDSLTDPRPLPEAGMPEPTPPEQADQSWRDEWSDAPMMSSEPQPSPDEWADAEAAPKKRAQEDAFSWTEDPAAADVRPRPDSNAAISWPDEPIEAPPPISWSDEIVAGPAPAQAPPAQAAPAQDPVTGTQRSKKLQSAPTAEQENLDKLNELRTKLGSMPAKIPNTLPGPAPAPSPGQRASSPAVSPYAPTIPQEALQPKPGDPYYAGQAEARRGAMGSRSSVLWIGLIVLGIVILGIVIAVVLLG